MRAMMIRNCPAIIEKTRTAVLQSPVGVLPTLPTQTKGPPTPIGAWCPHFLSIPSHARPSQRNRTILDYTGIRGRPTGRPATMYVLYFPFLSALRGSTDRFTFLPFWPRCCVYMPSGTIGGFRTLTKEDKNGQQFCLPTSQLCPPRRKMCATYGTGLLDSWLDNLPVL